MTKLKDIASCVHLFTSLFVSGLFMCRHFFYMSCFADDTLEGTPCNGQDYREVPRDCNSYLHCDGRVWRQQNCAPGLHWSQKDKHCDWPKYAKCQGNS